MKCKICNSENIEIIYCGKIRKGGIGRFTEQDVSMYQCRECRIIWHDNVQEDIENYYESTEYRDSLEGSSEIEEFYKLHDKETMAKFSYTGTECFRNKIVADIGCGGGAFLDFLKGVAKKIVAIEPSLRYREIMKQKGYYTYPYASEAVKEWKDKIEVITSFDVIEHVENPTQFLKEINQLLAAGGEAIIGTPTDAPVMRAVLGEIYEKRLLFSTQHLWIFAEENLKIIARQAGFKQVETKGFQRYGLNNFIGWMKEQRACGEPKYSFVSKTMNEVWKAELSNMGIADYIVLYLKK